MVLALFCFGCRHVWGSWSSLLVEEAWRVIGVESQQGFKNHLNTSIMKDINCLHSCTEPLFILYEISGCSVTRYGWARITMRGVFCSFCPIIIQTVSLSCSLPLQGAEGTQPLQFCFLGWHFPLLSFSLIRSFSGRLHFVFLCIISLLLFLKFLHVFVSFFLLMEFSMDVFAWALSAQITSTRISFSAVGSFCISSIPYNTCSSVSSLSFIL